MPISWPAARHIYLSPHLDDAILSCGGMIFRQAERGEPVAVITVFAGSPPPASTLSPFARMLHERWQDSAPAGQDFSDLPAVRRAEDIHAFSLLSPAIEVTHLALPDCIYRIDPQTGQALYASEQAIFGPIDATDPALDDLSSAPPLPTGATVYAPLAVGGHVDHRIVHQMTRKWGLAARQVCYYEDYPYAAGAGESENFLPDQAGWQARIVPLEPAALEAKIRAVSAYRTQISTFWTSEAAMAAALRDYAAGVGGERLWICEG